MRTMRRPRATGDRGGGSRAARCGRRRHLDRQRRPPRLRRRRRNRRSCSRSPSGTPPDMCESRCPATECERLNLPPMCANAARRPPPRTGSRSTGAGRGPGSRRPIGPERSPSSRHRVLKRRTSGGRVMLSRDRLPTAGCWNGGESPRRRSTLPASAAGGRRQAFARSCPGRTVAPWRAERSSSTSPTSTDCRWSPSPSSRRIGGAPSHRSSGSRRRSCRSEAGTARVIGYRGVSDGAEHLAVIVGAAGADTPVALHVHRRVPHRRRVRRAGLPVRSGTRPGTGR